MVVNNSNTKSYTWGDQCKAWELLLSDQVIIKEELMPPQTQEQLHFHHKTDQFFYILEGEATFNIDQKNVSVSKGEGIEIKREQVHKIANTSSTDLRFLVLSFPGNSADRINLKQ
ncbi:MULTISPECIES: cupin domain-containing protein [Galbibacter]|uniref:Cupin 2 barrel domain-containing protein n=1 Tax=Galbibacter marinus TaxID=555500 RepID=K2PVC2_9FLAO|nr:MULTISPECIES: cupin domain-containing protein [Galbibacter]EKF55444.1 cupin 2 barrel domain-containing protein [Galbibacter marinus]HLV63497.1 cupin domain-containing protein [Galbibacter sp.]